MTWRAAARIVAARRRTPRIEWLCSDANPDVALREEWRARVLDLAGTAPAAQQAEMPAPAQQASALGRALWDWAVSGFATTTDAERRSRLDACITCPEWDSSARRCKLCGCFTDAKIRMKTERCPLGQW